MTLRKRKPWEQSRAALPVPSEDAEQRALAECLDALGLLWCHVPNGGNRDPITAAIMRAQGVKPGVPDVLVFSVPPAAPFARGVAIELKRQQAGRVSPEQRRWLAELEARGWLTFVAKGWQDAADWLRDTCGWGT